MEKNMSEIKAITKTRFIGAGGGAGTEGPVGPTGPIGPVGPTGPKGDKGEQGLQGPAGTAGKAGAAAGFGTPTASVTSLTAGAQPTVNIAASGANTAKVFNFTFGIPKGEKGDAGVAGPAGPAGATGPKGEKGATGAKGEKGDPGYPTLPEDAATKTYVLKAVNGVLTWVEEAAAA